MNDSIRNRVQVALEVQSILKRHTGLKPVIAGGAARDVYYGVVPKDFDIIFPDTVSYSDLSGFFASLGITSRTIPMYDGRALDRIKTVNKFNWQGVDFDLIVYAIGEDESVTDYFDVNFNQFILEGHTARFTGDPSCWDHHFGGVKYLRQVRADASDKRMNYIRDKFQKYREAHLYRSSELDL